MAVRESKKRNFFGGILAELSVARLTWLTNLRSAMELRAAFLLQVVGMAVNDCSFVIAWLIFFNAVGTVNGWGAQETIALLGFNVLGFGLTFGFAGGSMWLPRYVEQGTFDGFLLSPRNLYVRTVTSRFEMPALGDALLGIILLIVYAVQSGSLISLVWFLAMLPATVIIYMSVSMTCSTAAFYFPDADHIVLALFKMFLTPGLYPSALFPKIARFIFIVIIPSLAIGGLPVEAVKDHDFSPVGMVWAVEIGWLLISLAAFYGSVRRYESGNYIGMRS